MSKKKKKKLSPFEQNRENIKAFSENVKLYESVIMLVEASKHLNLFTDESVDSDSLNEMLKSTIIQFSEFIEDRGDQWN